MNRNLLGLVVALLLFTPQAFAQFVTGPSASAMGNAGIAAVDPGESSFLNPASLGYLQRYFASGLYSFGKNPQNGDQNLWGVILADGTSEALIPGSLSYVKRRSDFPDGSTNTQQDIQLAFATAPLRNLSFGVAAHRRTDQYLNAAQTGGEHNQYNGHLGVLYVPHSSVGLGFVMYDFFPTPDSIPSELRAVPTFGVGAHYLYEKIFRVRLDLVRPDTRNDGQRINVGTGIETLFREDFGFRLGYQWRETSDQGWFTTGVAYRGPRLSLDYTFQKDLRVAEGYRHLFDLWIPL